MSCCGDVVDEPGLLTDGGPDADRKILRELEAFEVVEDNGFVDRDLIERERAQEQSASPEPGGPAGDGRRCASKGAGELAVGRAGVEACSDRRGKLGALQILDSATFSLPGQS